MDNVFENLHKLSTTLATSATSIVTVTMLASPSAPTVNIITRLTKVRMGVGTQTERTRTYYYDPQTFLTYFLFFSRLSRFSASIASNLVVFPASPFRLHNNSFSTSFHYCNSGSVVTYKACVSHIDVLTTLNISALLDYMDSCA